MNPGRLQLPSLKNQVSPEEWNARVDLAACYRLIAHYGMSDMMANHVTIRVPGEDNAFLTNPYGMMYEEMFASCFIKINHDGQILSKPDFVELNYELRHIPLPEAAANPRMRKSSLRTVPISLPWKIFPQAPPARSFSSEMSAHPRASPGM